MSVYSRILPVIGIILLLGGVIAGTSSSTISYALFEGNRSSVVDVATDSNGVLALDKASDIGVNTVTRLLTITNNFGGDASVTISLDTTADADLYVGGTNVGDSYTTTLAAGNSIDIDVEVTSGNLNQVQFDVTGDSGANSFEALDRVVDTKGSVTAAFSYSCDISTLTCTFDASSSSTTQGSISTYSWDFGDGGTGSGETTSHTYSSTGTYSVTLTVTNNKGASDTKTKTIDLTTGGGNSAPTADFTYTRKGNSNNVDLDGSASSDPDGSISTYEWDVGNDGVTDYTGVTVSAKIPTGTVVNLTVTDNNGATDSVTKTV